MAIVTTADQSSGRIALPAIRAQHPLYAQWRPVWEKCLYVAEGAGGFLDGTNLWAHPREWQDHTADAPAIPTKKLKARRTIARYENVAELLISQVSGALFRVGPQRLVGDGQKDHPLGVWWTDVDGQGTEMTPYLRAAWNVAATFGHVFLLMDRAPDDPTRLYLRTYTPLDAPDWAIGESGQLTAIKFAENANERSLLEPYRAPSIQYRFVGQETVGVAKDDGTWAITETDHGFGTLPVVVLYAKRRKLIPVIGAPVIGDPQLHYDLYNLISEERELLRNQTFGIVNVPLGTGDTAVSVEDAKAMMGIVAGTDSVLFTPQEAQYLQPDTANVTAYAEHRAALLRTIYRLAAVPYEADSRDAEAADSRRIKRDDFTQQLSAYADELQTAERAIVDLWCRGTYGERWREERDRAAITVRYPDRFDSDTLDDLKTQLSLMVLGQFPHEVRTAVQVRAIPQLVPDATPQQITELTNAVENAPDPAREQAKLLEMAQGSGRRPPQPPTARPAA